MRVSKEYPPKRVYDACVHKFRVDFKEGVVFTYGNTLHSLYRVPDDLMAHEEVHAKQQQEMGVIKWWDTYLADDAFRLQQELEAYQAQYQFYKKKNPNKEQVFQFLRRIVGDLSGKMYGNLIPYGEALMQIKNGTKD